MREMLADPKVGSQKFLPPATAGHAPEQIIADIKAGGCPGERVIAAFFGRTEDNPGTLNIGDIRLALQTFRETGELAAWHGKHNPKATKTADAIDAEKL